MGSIDGPNHCAYPFKALEKELFRPSEKLRISVIAAAGLMGFTICWRLKREGHYIIASDWRENKHMAKDEFCDECHVVDLKDMDNCLKVTRGVDLVFNFATSTGSPGFSESNPSVIMCNDTTIGYNMVEATRINGVQRYFHASIAYIYAELEQVEAVACLAESQYPIGFEKPETEVLCERYHKDFGFECRIGRFYCIYGPFGTWEGGRGKARAAFCGEPSTSTDKLGMLWDGPHTRYVEGVLRLMESDCREPVYIGCLDLREVVNGVSNEIVSENEAAETVLGFEDKKVPPMGEKLGCAGLLKDWSSIMGFWIKDQVGKVKAQAEG